MEDRGTRKSIAYDPEFRTLLGPQFEQFSDDDLVRLVDAILDAMREAAEEIAATVPIIPGLYIKCEHPAACGGPLRFRRRRWVGHRSQTGDRGAVSQSRGPLAAKPRNGAGQPRDSVRSGRWCPLRQPEML